VGDQGLAGVSVESHALVAQCEVADFGVVEGLVSSSMAMYVVAAPGAGESDLAPSSSTGRPRRTRRAANIGHLCAEPNHC
jgi:hypothetical protein